jgi:hypothetical protein
MVVRQLMANAEVAKESIVNVVRALRGAPPSPHAHALRDAIITNRDAIPVASRARLTLLLDQYL